MFKDWKKYLAEMLGTMALMLFAVGTAIFSGDFVATGLAFGLALIAIIYVIGPISGGHVNPAVSLAFLIKKKLSAKDFAMYVCAQVIGALLGGLILFGMISIIDMPNSVLGMGANYYTGGLLAGTATGWAIVAAMLTEIIITFLFVLTIIAMVRKDENKHIAPLVIGLALILVHFIGMNLTGTSVNPARSFGSAVFGSLRSLEQVWLFIVAPLIGGALAAVASCFIFCDKCEKEVAKEEK